MIWSINKLWKNAEKYINFSLAEGRRRWYISIHSIQVQACMVQGSMDDSITISFNPCNLFESDLYNKPNGSLRLVVMQCSGVANRAYIKGL